MNRFLLAAVLAFASTAVFSSVPDPDVHLGSTYERNLPPEEHQGKVEYLAGGLNEKQANAIKRASQDFPLELVFRQKVNGKEKDLYDVPVTITDVGGKVVFKGDSPGPYFIARLPKGTYTVTAHWDDWNFSKQVTIGGDRDRVVFAWDKDTPQQA